MGIAFLASLVFGLVVIAGQSGSFSFGKSARLTTWNSNGQCGARVKVNKLTIKLITDTRYPCKAREYKDGTLVSYAVEDADEVFILCGNITNRKDKNKALKNDYFEGQGYQAVIFKNGKVWLSEYKDLYCAPHSFEAPQHALLVRGKLIQTETID